MKNSLLGKLSLFGSSENRWSSYWKSLPAAKSLIERMIAIGEEPTDLHKYRIAKTIKSLQDNDLFDTQFDVFVPTKGVGDGSTLLNWIKDANNAQVSGTPLYIAGGGWKKNQATSYLNTKYNLATQSSLYKRDDACWIIKVADIQNEADKFHGCLDAGANGIDFSNVNCRFNGSTTITTGYVEGWNCLTRTSSSAGSYMEGGRIVPFTGKNSSALPSLEPYIFRVNFSTAYDVNTLEKNEFYAFGKQITQAKFIKLQEIMDDYYDDVDYIVNGYAYNLKTKILTIPTKGVANILSQNDNWKLAYFTGEDILYLSNDCGATWAYSSAFTGCANIRMAFVFKTGAILIALRNNKVYSSQDFLTSINEITVKEMNGSDMSFHVPSNPAFPGEYFNAYGIKSAVVGGKEVLLWGLYDCYNNVAERTGAAPSNVYYSADDGVSVKVCYKWGTGIYQYDKGTWDSDGTGTALGDPGNANTIDHNHVVSFNPNDNSFWLQTGDTYPKCNWAKFVYDSNADTWTITPSIRPNEAGWRATGLAFINGGTDLIWPSDQDGNVYRVPYANILSAIANHTTLYNGAVDLLGISEYGQVMFATGFASVRFLLVSVDYGATWAVVPDGYKKKLMSAQTLKSGYLWYPFENIKILNGLDSNGYYLLQRTVIPGPFNATNTMLLKVVKR